MPLHLYTIFFIKMLAILAGIYSKRYLSLPFRYIIVHACLALIAEIVGRLLFALGYNNVWLFNVFTLVDMCLMSAIACMFITQKHLKSIIYTGVVAMAVYWLYSVINIRGGQYISIYTTVCFLFLTLVYTTVLYSTVLLNVEKLYKHPVFLVSIAAIVDYACSIPFYGTMNYFVATDMDMAGRLFFISHTVNCIRYVLVATAFYLYIPQTKRSYVRQ